MNKRPAWVLVVLLISGCLGAEDAGTEEPGAPDARPLTELSPGNGTTSLNQSVESPFHMISQLIDCQGWFFEILVPSELNPGTPPGGWPAADPRSTFIRYIGLECLHFSSGATEQEGVAFVFELHDNMEPPLECHAPDSLSFALAHVAARANLTGTSLAMLGIPIESASIDVEPMADAPFDLFEWTTTRGSGAMRYLPEEAEGIGADPIRAFYEVDGHIAAIAISMESAGSEPGSMPARLSSSGDYLAAQLAPDLAGAATNYNIDRMSMVPIDLEASGCA